MSPLRAGLLFSASVSASAWLAACGPAENDTDEAQKPSEQIQAQSVPDPAPKPLPTPDVLPEDTQETAEWPPYTVENDVGPPVPGYGAEWSSADFWAGEYPHGLFVYEKDITVKARTAPEPGLAETLSCPLTFKGAYHPWNGVRNIADGLKYKTITKAVRFKISSPTSITFNGNPEAGTEDVTQVMKSGQEVIYLGYLGEGWGLFRVHGYTYDEAIDHFESDTHKIMIDVPPDEWLGLPCTGGYGWYLIPKKQNAPGTWSGISAVRDYGTITDMTDAEAGEMRENVSMNAAQSSDDETPIPKAGDPEDHEAFTVSDPKWYVLDSWAGEYPGGIAVFRKDVTVPGHETLGEVSDDPVACPIDYLGNYHPWNRERVLREKLKFIQLTETVEMTLTRPFEFAVYDEETESTLYRQAAAGDPYTYLGYLGEGYVAVRYKGEEYEEQFEDLIGEGSDRVENLEIRKWLRIPCGDRMRWFYLGSTEPNEGLRFGRQGWGDSYGSAPDISEERAARMRSGDLSSP